MSGVIELRKNGAGIEPNLPDFHVTAVLYHLSFFEIMSKVENSIVYFYKLNVGLKFYFI